MQVLVMIVGDAYPFQSIDILHEEPVGVEPWQEDILKHISHAILLELEVVSPHHWRVDEVETDSVCPIFVNHIHGVWVILFSLAHFLSITAQIQKFYRDECDKIYYNLVRISHSNYKSCPFRAKPTFL